MFPDCLDIQTDVQMFKIPPKIIWTSICLKIGVSFITGRSIEPRNLIFWLGGQLNLETQFSDGDVSWTQKLNFLTRRSVEPAIQFLHSFLALLFRKTFYSREMTFIGVFSETFPLASGRSFLWREWVCFSGTVQQSPNPQAAVLRDGSLVYLPHVQPVKNCQRSSFAVKKACRLFRSTQWSQDLYMVRFSV